MKREGSKSSQGHDNSFGVVAVVFGILSLVFASIYGVIFGVIAIVFARQQKRIFSNGWSKSGTILGVLGIVVSFAVLVWIVQNASSLAGALP